MPTWLHIKQYNHAIIRSLGHCEDHQWGQDACFVNWDYITCIETCPWFLENLPSPSKSCNKYIPMWCISLYKLQGPGLKPWNRWFYAWFFFHLNQYMMKKDKTPLSLWYSYLHLQQHRYLRVKKLIYSSTLPIISVFKKCNAKIFLSSFPQIIWKLTWMVF